MCPRGRGTRRGLPRVLPPQVPDKDTPMANRLFLPLVALTLVSALPASQGDPAPGLSAERIRADVAYLASDRLEGRGPGTRGEILATEYIADGFRKAGLKPLGKNGT